MDVLEVDRLTKKYGDLAAFDQISFTVHEPETFRFPRTEWGGLKLTYRLSM